MYFLRFNDTQVLGSSPEMLVRVTGRKLEYRPVAGTHRRGRDEVEDQQLEQNMLQDEKERAEHVMRSDEDRNDLRRPRQGVCRRLRDKKTAASYAHAVDAHARPASTTT